MFYLKAGFHMIADRRSQIAIRSAIVCDRMETTSAIVCDPAIVIADDRRSSFLMIADGRRPYCNLRSAIIWKPAFNDQLSCLWKRLFRKLSDSLDENEMNTVVSAKVVQKKRKSVRNNAER